MTRLIKLVIAFGLLGAMSASPTAMAASAAEIDVRVKETIEEFKKNVAQFIDDVKKQNFSGKGAPRIVLFSPIALEKLPVRSGTGASPSAVVKTV